MLKNYLLYGIFALLLLGACNKDDDDLTASEVVDWFAIKDKPGELGHLLYDIYQKSGVSIFINDTLGYTYAGKDGNGNPVNQYETVYEKYLIYSMLGDKIRHVLSSDTMAMLKAARVIEKWVVPNLAPEGENRSKSFLLVDSLLWNAYGGDTIRKGGGTAWTFDLSIETTPVGKLSDIRNMDEHTLKFWAGMILAARVRPWLDSHQSEEMKEFYGMVNSDLPAKAKTLYQIYDNWYWVNEDTGEKVSRDAREYGGADLWDYWRMGFLEWADSMWEEKVEASWIGPNVKKVHFKVPTKNCDAMNFIAAVYAYSDEEFESLFAEVEYSEKCIKKRLYMKTLVKMFEDVNGITRQPFK